MIIWLALALLLTFGVISRYGPFARSYLETLAERDDISPGAVVIWLFFGALMLTGPIALCLRLVREAALR